VAGFELPDDSCRCFWFPDSAGAVSTTPQPEPLKKITYISVFITTLLLGWVFLALFGDFNMYVVYPQRTQIKAFPSLGERIMWGLVFTIPLALLNTVAVWLWSWFWPRLEAKTPNTQ
jgi:hypothetical protein